MYDIYPEVLRLYNYRIDFTSSGELNMSTLRANLRRGIDVLFLVNPGQPIESHLDLQEISELASEARRFGSLVFVDEAYYGFGSETAISLLADNDNLLIGRSFSKTFGAPGIRLGFIVAQRHITNRLLSLRLAHEMNSLSLLVAQHLLLNKSTIEEYNREIMKTRDYLLERLTSIGIPAFGSMANYLRLDLKNYKREFITHLSERNIRVKDGFPSPWDSSVTATVGPLREMEPLLEAVSSFANQT
jgi:histidinol-phosphate aminotransferase